MLLTIMNKPKIVFLLESISQPRCIKRVNSFISKNYDVDIYGIDRGIYNENANISGKSIIIIDEQRDGKNHINKFYNNYKSIKKILSLYDLNNTVFYSFGFALTLPLMLNKSRYYIYEISDILYGYKKFNFIRSMLKKIDKQLIKKSLVTVLTSKGFGNFLFKKIWPQNIIIQPNKLDTYFLDKKRPGITSEFNNKNVKFAFVGSFRYPNTIFRFAKIIGENYPNHEFQFYGDSELTNEVINISNKFQNVKYFGSFKNPDDLQSIYDNFDIVVACYDSLSLNERIAEPNKLYEALYFNKPIIVSENTFLSDRVSKLQCGFIINALNDDSIISFIDSIDVREINSIKKTISTFNNDDIIDDDSRKIIDFIEKKQFN